MRWQKQQKPVTDIKVQNGAAVVHRKKKPTVEGKRIRCLAVWVLHLQGDCLIPCNLLLSFFGEQKGARKIVGVDCLQPLPVDKNSCTVTKICALYIEVLSDPFSVKNSRVTLSGASATKNDAIFPNDWLRLCNARHYKERTEDCKTSFCFHK